MIEDFKTADGKKITKHQLIKEIVKFLNDDEYEYKVLVGTDSECFNDKVDFVSVIVIHRVGYGARYFWQRKIYNRSFSLHERLWQEALLSLNIGQEILKFLIKEKAKFHFELHLDLSTTGKSSSSLKEIINLIRSYGFEVRIKPESYAATKIADRLI